MNIIDIINKKRELIKGLEENIFKTYSEEEELLLHSKHGRIKITFPDGTVIDGLTPAFKCGLECLVETSKGVECIGKIETISWDCKRFKTVDDNWYIFEFTPMSLYDKEVF